MNEIIALVSKYLEKLEYHVQVLLDGVRQENDWWYVPVHADPEPTQRWRYYEDLNNIENAIETNDGIRILLIPAS